MSGFSGKKITYHHTAWLIGLISLIIASVISLIPFSVGMAKPLLGQDSPEPPKRQKTITIYNDHEWWLVQWQDNKLVCRFSVAHDGYPTKDEITYFCGENIYTQWVNTPACSQPQDEENRGVNDEAVSCQGLYLHKNVLRPEERQVVVDLPLPSVKVSLPDCNYSSFTFYCPDVPALLLTAEEPLPDESILAVYFTLNGNTYMCDGSLCLMPLTSTGEKGVQISFWATSSYGDESEHFTASVRVSESSQAGWLVNVLSTQLDGGDVPLCSMIWGASPPLGELPAWLQAPEYVDALASDVPYVYLAGRIIAKGVVDASVCPGNGLLPNGAANPCGLKRARAGVNIWQNYFDPQILQVSGATGVPAQLLKNIIAQESQFWTGTPEVNGEYGLGHMTEMGADTLLLWNPPVFQEFCPRVLSDRTCEAGYANLSQSEQALLRGALAVAASTECPDCPYGFDLENTQFSIYLLAQSLLASCAQVDQIIYNITLYNTNGLNSGEVSSYEDLWRFALVNYNAGPGCLSEAVIYSWLPDRQLTWDDVSRALPSGCGGAIQYVENVTRDQ